MKRLICGMLMIGTLSACSTIDKINPFLSANGDRGGALPSLKDGAEIAPRWRVGVGSAGVQTFSPATNASAVYAASVDGSVARIENGSVVWRVSVGQPLSGGVGADAERVVVGTPKGDLITLDAKNGKAIWRARLSSEILSAPVIADGLVIARSGDSRVFGFDIADGKRKWVYQRGTPSLTLRSSVGVYALDGKTFAGMPGGKLVALSNNNGAALWESTVALPKGATELERVTDVTSEPVVFGNLVCAVAFQGKLTCFDAASGNVAWTRDISSSAGLDADAKAVYVADDAGVIQALSLSTGATLWRQDKLKGRSLGRPLVVGERVLLSDDTGYIHVLDRADGSVVGRGVTDKSGIRSVLKKMGTGVLAQSVDGNVFFLEWAN